MKKINIEEENIRLQKMLEYEKAAYLEGYKLVAGIDEAGRGPLAGPVVAASCILPKGTVIIGLNDSKKISEKNRELLYEEIINKAEFFGIGMADNLEIDNINILNATKLAMKRAIESMGTVPDLLLIDAVKLEMVDIPQIPIIKGDSLSLSIAAASILAKVTRDRLMIEYCKQFPDYQFEKHKGYGTKLHYDCIKKFDLSSIHRKSFTKGYW